MRSSRDNLAFIKWRLDSLHSLGVLSLSEIVKLWLPASRRPQSVYAKFLDWQDIEAGKRLDANDEYFMFFGKKFFHKGNLKELEDQIKEIVHEDSYCLRLLKRGAVVVDAGAMLGVFSVTAAQRGLMVYSFEASPESFETLRKTTIQYDNITSRNLGLGDKEEKGVFHVGHNLNRTLGGNSFSRKNLEDPDGMIKYEIPIKTIDSFKFFHVDCIKIDTEGYELKILQGAARTIRRDKPLLMVSAYHNKEDEEEIPRFIKSLRPDYDIRFESKARENFICR